MDRRRMCPHCRAFITNSDRICPYCNEPVGPRYVERMPDLKIGGLIPQSHFTTAIILLINFGLYIGTSLSGNVLLMVGAKLGQPIFIQHEWWRLITAGFLHAGLLHIGMNSWALYQLGAQVEELYGTARYLAIYFFSTLGGFYLSARLNPMSPSVGSSAGIAGLIGAMIAFGVMNRSSVGRQIRDFYLQSVVYMIAIGFMPGFRVDNWAHAGGLGAGFLLSYAAGTVVHSSRAKESFWKVVALACVLITLFCFLMMYTHYPTADQLQQMG